MTYLDRINYLWNLRRNGALRGSEHELCAFLLDAFNRLGWKNPMTQTNALICGLLGMSEKSLMLSRNGLKQDGLIDFKPGRKGSPTTYILNQWPPNALPNALSYDRAKDSTNGGTNAVQMVGLLKIQEKDPSPASPKRPGVTDVLAFMNGSSACMILPEKRQEVAQAYIDAREGTDPPWHVPATYNSPAMPIAENWQGNCRQFCRRWRENEDDKTHRKHNGNHRQPPTPIPDPKPASELRVVEF